MNWWMRVPLPFTCWANSPASSPTWTLPAHGQRPVPILLAMAEPNGPVEQAFFDRMMMEMSPGHTRHAGYVDGVYCAAWCGTYHRRIA